MNTVFRNTLIVETYEATGSLIAAQRAASCHYDTVMRVLVKEGVIKRDLGYRVKATQRPNIVKPRHDDGLVRVHRDPCPKCAVRRDIGCKHFPLQSEPQRPMTDRERAEALWSKKP